MSLPALLLPTVLPCYDGGYITLILAQMLTFANYAWYALSGYTLANPEPFLIYLSIIYWEEIFINYTLYGFFTFGFTNTQLNDLNVMCSATALSIPTPSIHVQLTVVLTTFTVMRVLIRHEKLIPNRLIFAYILLLNLAIPFVLFYTGNVSLIQVFFAVGLGVFNSIRRSLLFEFYFNGVWRRFLDEWYRKT